MSERTNTTYVVTVNVSTPEEAGRVGAAVNEQGYTDVRFAALEQSGRRALNQDEMAIALPIVAAATDRRRQRGELDPEALAGFEQAIADYAEAVKSHDHDFAYFTAPNELGYSGHCVICGASATEEQVRQFLAENDPR